MPLVKKMDKVTLIGIFHTYTEYKGFTKYIKNSDIVAMEGYGDREGIDNRLLNAFFGKEERKFLNKLHIRLTTLDPNVKGKIKKLKSPIIPALVLGGIVGFISFLNPFFFIAYSAYSWSFIPVIDSFFTGQSNKLLRNEYYLKFIDMNYKLLAQTSRYVVTERDLAMAYGIKKLTQVGYPRVTAVVGMNHVYPIHKSLKDKNLDDKFLHLYRKKYFRKKGLTIYSYNLEEVGFVPYFL